MREKLEAPHANPGGIDAFGQEAAPVVGFEAAVLFKEARDDFLVLGARDRAGAVDERAARAEVR
jgi:hypothetical protein